MDKIRIRGGKPLHGTVQVSGAKNAALPILISSLLSEQPCVYENVPNLQDIRTTLKLLAAMGVHSEAGLSGGRVEVDASRVEKPEATYDLVRTMRASVVVLGPLLARFGRAKVSLPGGCAIGARPINFHLEGFEALGAKIEIEGGYVLAEAKKLRGAVHRFPFPSVGATENLMMAAVLAEGETELRNVAKEPEIVDLGDALIKMGAKIEGHGTETIRIQGVRSLKGAKHRIMGDRIEAGTFLCAALITGGSVRVEGISPIHLESVLVHLEDAGARVTRGEDFIEIKAPARPGPCDVTTAPFPGFPTDMQAQFMAAMAVSTGTSRIIETVFENRFMHVPELARLGADISIRGNMAVVNGKAELLGAPLMATDLRASASLVLGGLCAHGETIVNRIYHLDRGYEEMEKKLSALGADITRLGS